MLHNCWQDENQMKSMKQPHSMHDADGIPRVAFYVNPNGLISQPLGHHNFYINEAIYNRLKDFADQSGHILAGPQSYEFHPDHPEYYGDFMHEGSTRTCARCHAEIDGPICSECGYDPTHADSDYEKSKANWYERAWDDAGKNQPRQVPNQPMHWRDDHAKDVKFARGIDQRGNDHTVGSVVWASPRQNYNRSSREAQADISILTTSLNNSTDAWREI